MTRTNGEETRGEKRTVIDRERSRGVGVHVFLGPSLSVAEAKQLLPDAIYHGPAAMGDIYRVAAGGGASTLALIDGLFDRVPAPWHKEILFALENGVRVLGASSMGALRGSELHAFGMEGVGVVFRDYAEGRLEDDDEVALAHASREHGYRPLSVPMVNIRAGLQGAMTRGLLDGADVDAIVAQLKTLFYPARTWAEVRRAACERGLPPEPAAEVVAVAADGRYDVKAQDARELLRTLAREEPPQPPVRGWGLERTIFWQRMVSEVEGRSLLGAAETVDLEDVAGHVRATGAPDELLASLVADYLVELECERRGIAPSRAEVQGELDRWRREAGLTSTEATARWLETENLSSRALVDRLVQRLKRRKLGVALGRTLHSRIPGHLARSGELEQVMESLVQRRSRAEDPGRAAGSASDLRELLGWYEGTFHPLNGSLAEHAERLGFASVRELLDQLRVERAAALHEAGGARGGNARRGSDPQPAGFDEAGCAAAAGDVGASDARSRTPLQLEARP